MNTVDFLQTMYAQVPTGVQACVTIWDISGKSTHCPLGDTQAILTAAAQRELTGQGTFFCVGLTRPGLSSGSKGGKKDIVALPAFFLDVDIAGPGHAAKQQDLPTEEQADDIIASCPLAPTLVVHSGGGYHAYWIFEEAIVIQPGETEKINALSKAWQQKFIDWAAARKLHVDQTGNIDRVLRLPGTSNFKTGTPRPVQVVFEGIAHKLDACLALLSAVVIPQSKPAVSSTAAPAQYKQIDLDDLRKRMRRVSNNKNRTRMLKVLNGEPFAKAGARDEGLQAVVSTIAFVTENPESTSPVEIAEILRPSLDAMQAEANDPANPSPTIMDAIEKFGRALQDAAASRAKKKAENAEWMPWLTKLQEKPFERMKIGIGTDAEPVVDTMIEALVKLGRHDLRYAVFVHAGRLADIATDDAHAPADLKRPKDSPWIRTIPLKGLVERLSSAAEFGMFKKDKDGFDMFEPCLPPLNFAEFLDARSSWPQLPHLEGIVETPAMLAGGRILDTPGYDPESGLLFSPLKPYLPVPAAPTLADAQAAMTELLDWAQDFPFKADHDKSALAALILTCLSRHAIDGPVPAFTFSAPTPGAGKSMLLSGAILVALGRPATTMSLINDEAEMDKRLLSIGLSGTAVAVFDDLSNGTLGTSALSRVLTDYSGKMSGRLLGKSKMVTTTIKTVFVASGNNISYANTLARRVVECTIDPGIENPQLRSGWKYPNLQGHILQNRERLVVCALTILRAHFLAGSPSHTEEAMGSFEKWDAVVRSAIIWTGRADPCAGRTQMRIASDSDTEALRTLVASWSSMFGTKQMSIAAAITVASSRGVGGLDLLHAFSLIDERHRPAQLGKAFSRWRDRVVDGRKIECAINPGNKASEWRVTPISNVIQMLVPTPQSADGSSGV